MITYKSDTKKTVYTIVNYQVYQDYQKLKNDTETTQKHNRSITEAYQKHTNNNINNINNINKDIVEKNYPYHEVIKYLNLKTNKSYKYSTAKTKELIRARVNEGFDLEDFKKVIDNKVSSWKGDSKMEQYLRPMTLFGNKFESYLNETVNDSVNEGVRAVEELEKLWTY